MRATSSAQVQLRFFVDCAAGFVGLDHLHRGGDGCDAARWLDRFGQMDLAAGIA
jgi:hypothetical protein